MRDFAKKFAGKWTMVGGIYCRGMQDATKRAAEILHGSGGRRIYLFLLDYARKVARRYGWRTEKSLPLGTSPDSVVNSVIVKVLEGDRNWDGASETSLVYSFQGMIRSDIGHLFGKLETRSVVPIAIPLHGDPESGESRERTPDDFPSCSPDPEAKLIDKERRTLEETAYELILKSVEDDDELSTVALSLHDTDSPAEISSKTSIPIKRVYQLLRTLYRKAAALRLPLIKRAAKGGSDDRKGPA